jgi:hypothetical protein
MRAGGCGAPDSAPDVIVTEEVKNAKPGLHRGARALAAPRSE